MAFVPFFVSKFVIKAVSVNRENSHCLCALTLLGFGNANI